MSIAVFGGVIERVEKPVLPHSVLDQRPQASTPHPLVRLRPSNSSNSQSHCWAKCERELSNLGFLLRCWIQCDCLVSEKIQSYRWWQQGNILIISDPHCWTDLLFLHCRIINFSVSLEVLWPTITVVAQHSRSTLFHCVDHHRLSDPVNKDHGWSTARLTGYQCGTELYRGLQCKPHPSGL
jgi:hypothetical protein